MTRTLIYARQALANPAELDRQVVDIHNAVSTYGGPHGWTVTGVLAEAARAGGSDRLVRQLASGGYDAVVAYRLDRYARTPAQLHAVLDAAAAYGVKVTTVDRIEFDADPDAATPAPPLPVLRSWFEGQA